jgi:hypothetical protein
MASVASRGIIVGHHQPGVATMFKLLAVIGMVCVATAALAQQQQQQKPVDQSKVNQCVQKCVQEETVARAKARCHEWCATGTYQR